MSDVMVSVSMVTYNHGKYLRQALDSILMQDVSFRYEVVVGDDCSTDQTRSILEEYNQKYPGVFKLLLRSKNTGRPTYNGYKVKQACRGKYIATLEGDDYWIDPHKLQKQVEFLEANPRFIGVAHNHEVVDAESNIIPNAKCKGWYPTREGVFTLQDLTEYGLPGHTATMMYRNIFLSPKYDYTILYKAHDFMGDITICPILLLQGDIWRMADVMSCRRWVRQEGGTNWNSIALNRDVAVEKSYAQMKFLKWCANNFTHNNYVQAASSQLFVSAVLRFLKKPDRASIKLLKDVFLFHPQKVELVPYIFKKLRNKLVRTAVAGQVR